MNQLFIAFLIVFYPLTLWGEGKFINPITDVCWECIFPITISGINVTSGYKDLGEHKDVVCKCPGMPPTIGLPLTFWEPTHLVDVTRHAFKLIGMGGISIGKESVRNRGTVGLNSDGYSQYSFYHVHWYRYPVLSWLDLLTDFMCVEKGDFDVGYITEYDSFWKNDRWALVANPEGALFANQLAQLSCIADCVAASFAKPIDELFWCGGCEGSLYPFMGTVGHHVGAIQASSLLVHRMIAKLHRIGMLKVPGDSQGNQKFCTSSYSPIIKKSLYKTQLAFPVVQSAPCNALGRSDVLWGSGKSFPYKGEDFVYVIWSKRQCCLDVVKPAMAGAAL